jgi:hypothetical protein
VNPNDIDVKIDLLIDGDSWVFHRSSVVDGEWLRYTCPENYSDEELNTYHTLPPGYLNYRLAQQVKMQEPSKWVDHSIA